MATEIVENKDYQRIEQALHYVAQNLSAQPSLAQIAASVHLSEYHFQRLFNRWAGVSPKQFLQYLTVNYARQCLLSGHSVLETSYRSGLSAPARLGELFIRLEAMTPGEVRRQGEGLQVAYGFHQTPFGRALIGATERGICALNFCDPEQTDSVLATVKSRLPKADFHLNQQVTGLLATQIFRPDCAAVGDKPLSLLVSGTAFQIKVWEALLRIPAGHRVSYQQLANDIGSPKAVRAIGTAVGRNPLAVLIPCHRVIRSDGLLGGYRWGLGRKLALQGWENTCIGNSAA